MYYLALSVAGLFVFDEKNELIKFKLFNKDPEEVARRSACLKREKKYQN